MDKNKLILPISILIGCFILGGFYYASQVNKQRSIERKEEQRTFSNEVKKQIVLFKDFLVRIEETMEACYKYGGYERHGYAPNKKYSQECASSVYLTERIRTTVAKPELAEAKESLLRCADLLDEYNHLIVFAPQQEYLNKVDSTYNQLLESITETREKLQ